MKSPWISRAFHDQAVADLREWAEELVTDAALARSELQQVDMSALFEARKDTVVKSLEAQLAQARKQIDYWETKFARFFEKEAPSV